MRRAMHWWRPVICVDLEEGLREDAKYFSVAFEQNDSRHGHAPQSRT
jgi:hypothetical protein